MKKLITATVLFCLMFGISELKAQDVRTNSGIGFQLNQFQNDFGMGLNYTSPYFANKQIAVRLRGNFMYNEHVENAETVWSPYANGSVGMVSSSGIIGNFMRLYGEGGVIVLFPNAAFSSETTEFGGYGLFGFEFFMADRNNYFIEIGGIGTGANADKVVNKPIYSNGLMLSTGFRIHLGKAEK